MGIRKPYKFGPERREKYLELLARGERRHHAAKAVGISHDTVCVHKRKDPEFARQCEAAETLAVERVENALFEAATEGKNVTAMQVWLYNRCPERWADRRGSTKVNIENRLLVSKQQIAHLPTDEIVKAKIVEDRRLLSGPAEEGEGDTEDSQDGEG